MQDMDKENEENNAVEEDEANFDKGKNEEESDDTEEEMEIECLMDDEFRTLRRHKDSTRAFHTCRHCAVLGAGQELVTVQPRMSHACHHTLRSQRASTPPITICWQNGDIVLSTNGPCETSRCRGSGTSKWRHCDQHEVSTRAAYMPS
ncbi:unnamed protein product [Arctia plantaginis]|uniref:Uncharacterized protein n=1 Tax=Arctia plantaginis TaxID=874455 RepID=A0A8S1AR76_ARCPL|nr:unnamed protein product [Arctia plantaginis]